MSLFLKVERSYQLALDSRGKQNIHTGAAETENFAEPTRKALTDVLRSIDRSPFNGVEKSKEKLSSSLGLLVFSFLLRL